MTQQMTAFASYYPVPTSEDIFIMCCTQSEKGEVVAPHLVKGECVTFDLAQQAGADAYCRHLNARAQKETLSEMPTKPTPEEPFEYFEYQDGFYAGMEIETPQALQEQLAHQQRQIGVPTPECWYQGLQAGFRARALRGEDPYTTVVPMLGRPGGVQKVRVPGILLQGGDPEFAEGYAWGRDCYYDEVDTLVWPDGTEVGDTATWEQLESAHSQKIRDITIDDVLHIFAEMQKDPEKEEDRASVPCRVGMLVGYITACIETSYDLVCKECGASPTTCTHR